MHYKSTSGVVTAEGRWDEKSCVRRVGGFDIDKTNLPAGMEYLPKGAVLAVNNSGNAVLVKTAKVYEEAAASSTSVKVCKGHALVVGDSVAGKAISAITVGTDYDTLTIAAISAKLTAGTVIADANAQKAVGLNYANVKLDDSPSCTITVQAYEIEEDSLPYPVNNDIKTALTCRHAFKI